MKNRVVHFEIRANDTERAATFYRDALGWEVEKWPGLEWEYWMIMTAPKESKDAGINGGLLKRSADMPPQGCGVNAFVCTVQVDNYDEVAKKIIEAGGKVVVPKFAFPGMAWQGYFLDTEGNTFGLHQADKDAK